MKQLVMSYKANSSFELIKNCLFNKESLKHNHKQTEWHILKLWHLSLKDGLLFKTFLHFRWTTCSQTFLPFPISFPSFPYLFIRAVCRVMGWTDARVVIYRHRRVGSQGLSCHSCLIPCLCSPTASPSGFVLSSCTIDCLLGWVLSFHYTANC